MYLKKEAKEFYKAVAKVMKGYAPEWLKEWKPGEWVIITVYYSFKAKKKFPDVENLNCCLTNAIMFALKEVNPAIDDQWFLTQPQIPSIGQKSDSVEFEIEVVRCKDA